MGFHEHEFQVKDDGLYLSQVPIDLRLPRSSLEEIGRCDALGDDRGHRELPEYHQAISLVLEQQLRVFGRKPQYYVARDVLLNATINDRRNWLFSRVRKNNPAWLYIGLPTTPWLAPDVTHMAQCRVFDYLHRRHTLQMLRDSDGEFASKLDRVARCVTSSYQIAPRPFSRTDGIRGRKAAEACHQTAICPHCFARQASNTFCSLKTKEAIQLGKGLFVLISVKHDWDQSDHAMVKDWKSDAKSQLVDLARRMGATGGMWSFQLTPTKDCLVNWNCGELIPSGESLGTRFAVLAYIPASSESVLAYNRHSLDHAELLTRNGIKPHFCVRQATDESELRRMIAGCSPTYREGFEGPGLFYWPPVWLCSQSQWKNRFDLLRGGRAFQCWGNWLGDGDKNRKSRIGLIHSTGLSNDQKRTEMRDRRGSLFPAAKSVAEDYVTSTGRFPGRRILGELLCSRGMNVSDRDVRWYCRELKGQM